MVSAFVNEMNGLAKDGRLLKFPSWQPESCRESGQPPPFRSIPVDLPYLIIVSESDKQFKVALSFPGERRAFVFEIAEYLASRLGRQRVLYDKYHEAQFAVLNLDIILPELYRAESELVVFFLCAEFSKKRWCSLEWRHVRQLIATEAEGRIMLVCFDKITEIPELGILPGDGYVDIGNRPAAEIAAMILDRLEHPLALKNPGSNNLKEKSPAWLAIPHRKWTGLPGALLRADLAVVPFHGRDEELKKWMGWAKSPDASPVSLLVGPGGMGKTRFARELCVALRIERMVCGFVDPADLESCISWFRLRGDSPALLVIDYAETVGSKIAELLRNISQRGLTAIRVLLLARGAGEWWTVLKRKSAGVGDLLLCEPDALGPLTLTGLQKLESYDWALAAFAEKLNLPKPKPDLPNLDSPDYRRALLLHMKALLAVQNINAEGMDPVLHAVLNREAEYWSKEREQRGLPAFIEAGFERLVGIVAAYDGFRDLNEALTVIPKINFFKDQSQAIVESVASLFHACYPGEKWIEPIQPDLLKEYLIEKVTRDFPADVGNIIF